jgi:hypothetical protein
VSRMFGAFQFVVYFAHVANRTTAFG